MKRIQACSRGNLSLACRVAGFPGECSPKDGFHIGSTPAICDMTSRPWRRRISHHGIRDSSTVHCMVSRYTTSRWQPLTISENCALSAGLGPRVSQSQPWAGLTKCPPVAGGRPSQSRLSHAGCWIRRSSTNRSWTGRGLIVCLDLQDSWIITRRTYPLRILPRMLLLAARLRLRPAPHPPRRRRLPTQEGVPGAQEHGMWRSKRTRAEKSYTGLGRLRGLAVK